MAKKAKRKPSIEPGRTREEERLRDDRRRLSRSIRDQKTIVKLARELQRATERAGHTLVELQMWLSAKTTSQRVSDLRQTGTES